MCHCRFVLQDNSVGADKLAASAITLGYAERTSNFITTNTVSFDLVTGLSVTVTNPGTRRIKITFGCRDAFRSGGGILDIAIFDTSVSGTILQQAEPNSPSGSAVPCTFMYISPTVPAAGSKTYVIGCKTSGGTANIEAGATYPTYILVEAI